MIKYKILLSTLGIVTVALFGTSCEDDPVDSVTFRQVYGAYDESAGTQKVTIPTGVTGSINANDISFDVHGTASHSEDFQIIGWSAEGLQIQIIDDAIHEQTEKATIRLISESGKKIVGNTTFELTITSDCDYSAGEIDEFISADWKGTYAATEIYAPNDTYGPYDLTLVQSDDNPNRFEIDNFWDNGVHAYMIIDPATGTITFPSQGDGSGSSAANRQISGTGTITYDQCKYAFTIRTKYFGSTWDYVFVKK